MATKKQSSGELSTEQRNNMADPTYAFPKERKEPLNNASHVRNAAARLDQVKDVTPAEKKAASTRIKTAAKKFGVEISAKSASSRATEGPEKTSAKKSAKKST